jgi:hypothetical protein
MQMCSKLIPELTVMAHQNIPTNFDWNAIAAGGTIISGIGTIISAIYVARQAGLMRKQNENSATQNELSVKQNAESLNLQTKLALYKERKEFIIKLEEAYNLNISEVLQSFKKNDEEISKFLAIQYKIDQFMKNYTNEENLENKEKALGKIKEIYETTKMQDYYNAPLYFIVRPSRYLLNNLITEAGLLFESKEVEKIRDCFKLLNDNLDKFRDLYCLTYFGLFANWFKLARSVSRYCMYGVFSGKMIYGKIIKNFKPENPDEKYNELLNLWEKMEEVWDKIAGCKYFGFTKKESEYYIPPIAPLTELLRKEIKLLP